MLSLGSRGGARNVVWHVCSHVGMHRGGIGLSSSMCKREDLMILRLCGVKWSSQGAIYCVAGRWLVVPAWRLVVGGTCVLYLLLSLHGVLSI